MKHIDQIRFSVEYYINEAQNWPTSLCTVTCSIGGGWSQADTGVPMRNQWEELGEDTSKNSHSMHVKRKKAETQEPTFFFFF